MRVALAAAFGILAAGCSSSPAAEPTGVPPAPVGSEDGGDASSGVDGGRGTDATTDASSANTCPAAYAGCTSFVEADGGAEVVISFTDYQYAPKCTRVRVGQQVAFEGAFGPHPLRQTCGPVDALNEAAGTRTVFTMNAAGTYGYYCLDHGNPSGSGMAGALDVVP